MASTCQALGLLFLSCDSQACSRAIFRGQAQCSSASSSPGDDANSLASVSGYVRPVQQFCPGGVHHPQHREGSTSGPASLTPHRSLIGQTVTSHVSLTNGCGRDSRLWQLTGGKASNSSSSASSSYSSTAEVAGDAITAPQQIPVFEQGDLEHPPWAGNQGLSRIVNSVLSIDPVFDVVQTVARGFVIRGAEKAGIPWHRMSVALDKAAVYKEKEAIEDKSITYPQYYLNSFHGYKEANLCWKAAFEVEAATLAMSKRALKILMPEPTAEESARLLRKFWLLSIQNHLDRHGPKWPIRDIIDIGCSTGISSQHLADAFPEAQVTGLDASPYFLSVASYKQKQAAKEGKGRAKPIRWVHGLAEDNRFPDNSFDMVSLCFLIHELPASVTQSILREARRLLRPGGILVVTDMSPKSKVVQQIPGPVAAFLKSTEPFLDEYFLFNLCKALEDDGFTNVESQLTTPRHATTTATA